MTSILKNMEACSTLDQFASYMDEMSYEVSYWGRRYFIHKHGEEKNYNELLLKFHDLVRRDGSKLTILDSNLDSYQSAPSIEHIYSKLALLDEFSKRTLSQSNIITQSFHQARSLIGRLFVDREKLIRSIDHSVQKIVLVIQKFSRQRNIEKRLSKNAQEAAVQQTKQPAVNPERLEIIKTHCASLGDSNDVKSKETRIEKITTYKETDGGIASNANKQHRESMQDDHLAKILNIRIGDQIHEVSIFGIFDGHGEKGEIISRLLKANLPKYIKQWMEKSPKKSLSKEDFNDFIFWALKESFKQFNKDLSRKEVAEESGSTATVTLKIGDQLWSANVGDSRTIIRKKSETLQVTEDQKPDMPRYKKRIVKKLGGKVTHPNKKEKELGAVARVDGNLAVARAFGDSTTRGVCAHPKITRNSYQAEDHLILGCDGLWDVLTTDEAGELVAEWKDQGFTAADMAVRFVNLAILLGSTDNISVMVVKL